MGTNEMLGTIEKMRASLKADGTLEYALPLGDASLPLNPLIGQTLRLTYSGRIFCGACGRKTKKSFNQGYCYPCFIKLAQCDTCIVKPELCHFAKGTCREPEWAREFCFRTHVVYLANSSGIKVGITRDTQIPIRWIDQGAVQALPLFKVKSRRAAGLVEVAIASKIPDKTNWRNLLKGPAAMLDMQEHKAAVLAQCQSILDSVELPEEDGHYEHWDDAQEFRCVYPVTQYPAKIQSFDFEKTPEVGGILWGIKGQYLIFDNGVINMRKFGGYEVKAAY